MTPNVTLVCLLAPNLPIQVEQQKRSAAASLIISDPVNPGVVLAASDDAAEAGVQAGISLYQARQMAPAARVAAPDEHAYHASHSALQSALQAFSPLVETVGLGELLLDARGLVRTYKDPQEMAEALGAAARASSGLSVRLGVASGRFTAQQAARQAPREGAILVPAGQEARFLAPLPISVLPNLPGELRRRMYLLDLHTLGDLVGLRKVAVLRQFGAELSSLYELARGNDPRPVNPDVPPLRLIRSLRLASPVDDRRILNQAASRLCWQLGKVLTARGYHAEALKLTLYCEDGAAPEIGQALKPPTSDDGRLKRLAAQLLGRVRLRAPVLHVALSAYPLRSWHIGMHQLTLMDAGVSARQVRLEETLQLLVHRFGDAVVRIAALFGPPLPLRIRVGLSPRGLPSRLEYGGLIRVVMGVDEHWREERFWWDRPVRRDCFRVILSDGSLRNIFQDLLNDEWYLDRAWPLL